MRTHQDLGVQGAGPKTIEDEVFDAKRDGTSSRMEMPADSA